MKKILISASFLFLCSFAKAQTWTGAAGTNWNIASNWNPMTIPTSNDIATIPGGTGSYPVLTSNVLLRSIKMQPGSSIDVNGFSITTISNSDIDFQGVTFNNSNAATDIILNLNVPNNLGFYTYFNSNIVNDNIVFNLSGSHQFLDGSAGVSNQFNGNVTYNIFGTSLIKISETVPSQFHGDLFINRTGLGETNVFNGGGNVSGNYSITDNTGSKNIMGNNNVRTSIAGTVNIAISDPSLTSASALLEIHRLINQTNGGDIHILNTAGFLIEKDTLLANSLMIDGTRGNITGMLLNNSLTCTTNLNSNISFLNSPPLYVKDNEFNGSAYFTLNGTNPSQLYESGNHYKSNAAFTVNSPATLSLSYSTSSTYEADLAITRTVAGFTGAFIYGAVINGNFTYTNNIGGNTHIGNFYDSPGRKTRIGGTINVTAHYITPDIFAMDDVENITGGGSVDVFNSAGANVKKDTLIVTSMSVTGYSTNRAEFFNNKITGNVTLADLAANSAAYITDLRNNSFNGTCDFTNNGSGEFYDAFSSQYNNYGNKYFGDVTYTRNNGSIYIAVGGTPDNINEYSQNLTLNSGSNIFLGKIKFVGSGNSVINQVGTQPVEVQQLLIEKTGTGKLTLNVPVTISKTVTFINGIIYSSATNPLIFADNASQTGASATSYLDGPVSKMGNTAFTFPIGTPGKFAPISISAPLNATDVFTAQYFSTGPVGGGYNTILKDPTIDHLSSTEYWILNRTVGTSDVYVTLSWDASRSGAISNLPDLKVARWNGSLWKDEGNSVVTGTTLSGTITSLNAINNFSPFTLASATPLNPLPLTLLNFNAASCNSGICLSWVTENEQNFSHFEIEKSTSGNSYTRLNSVSAKNTLSKNYYASTDADPITGNNFYRLKMVDLDGKFTYSNVIKIITDQQQLFSVSPNPAHNSIVLGGITHNGNIRIIDAAGKTQRIQKVKPGNNQINISSLPQGLYLIQIFDGIKSGAVRIIKL